MGRAFLIAGAAAVLFGLPLHSWAAGPLDNLAKDVEALKQENKRLSDRIKSLEVKDEQDSFIDKKQVKISGYADVEYDFTNQTGVNDHFRLRHMSLFFSQKVQKDWNFFSEIEWEDGPLIQADPTNDTISKAQGLFLMEQMYIQYRPDPELDISAGRLLTPAGIWLIYHYSPFIPTMERPLHIKLIFPQYSDGLMIRRSFTLFNSLVDTHFYAANGTDNPGTTDRNSNKAAGLRLQASTDLLRGKIEYGGSYLNQKNNSGTNQNSFGLHLKINYSALGLQSEYGTRQNSPVGADKYWDTGLYAQGTLDIKKWTLAARWDWYNSNSLTPQNDHHVYTGAVNYHFAHNITGKLELHRHEFNNPAVKNYYYGILSIALGLGDL